MPDHRPQPASLASTFLVWLGLAGLACAADGGRITTPNHTTFTLGRGSRLICIDFQYSDFADALTAATPSLNGNDLPGTCLWGESSAAPHSGSGICCFDLPTDSCAHLLEVHLQRPGLDVLTEPIQVHDHDPADPATLRCLPAPPRCHAAQTGSIVADSIDVVTGAMHYQETDFEIPGPIGIRFGRRYDSEEAGVLGQFGWGWRHSLEESVTCTPDGRMCRYVTRRLVRFRHDAAGRIREVTATVNGTEQVIASDIAYAPFGPITSICLGPSGSCPAGALQETTSYTGSYERWSYQLTSPARPVLAIDYGYGTFGLPSRAIDRLDPASSTSYDHALQRLYIEEGPFTTKHVYDANGNPLDNGYSRPDPRYRGARCAPTSGSAAGRSPGSIARRSPAPARTSSTTITSTSVMRRWR